MMGSEEKRVKDIMCPIEEYSLVSEETPLHAILKILRTNSDKISVGDAGVHNTIFIADPAGRIVGKLSIYDLIRGLVPEPVKAVKFSRALYSILTSRAMEVAEDIAEFQQHFAWLHHTFSDLVKQEAGKKVKEVMSPVYLLLVEEDSINKAIYVMFRENIRQPLVARAGKIVGVVRLMDVYPELLKIVGDWRA